MNKTSIAMLDGYGAGATDQIIDFTQKNLRINFPKDFVACIKQCDSGVPERPAFEFVNVASGKTEQAEIGAFLSFNPENEFNILRTYFTMPSFIPRTLLPFADIGNGDVLCFDYSVEGFEDKDPPVVYWIHDNPEGKEIVDIAITFKEFLNKLKPLSNP